MSNKFRTEEPHNWTDRSAALRGLACETCDSQCQLVPTIGIGCVIYLYIWNEDKPHGHIQTANESTSNDVTVIGHEVKAWNSGFPTLNLFQLLGAHQFSRFIHFYVAENRNECNDRRFLVYTCTKVCGGWGDRVKGIINSFLLAQLTERTFLIDMPNPCDLNKLVEPNLYNWNKCLPEVKTVSSKETYFLRLSKHTSLKKLNDMIYGKWKNTKVIRVRSRSRNFELIKNHALSNDVMPWLHNLTDADVHGSVIGTLFKATRNLSEALIKFKTEKVRGRRLICSHIRYGTNPTIPNDNMNARPNVSQILNFLKDYDTFDNTAIFVATDSIEIRNQSRVLFSNFISTEQKISHVELTKGETNELCGGFFAALLDQMILSRCDVLVLTRSNFGAMAAYMRGESANLFLNIKDLQGTIAKVNVDDIQKIYHFN